MLPQRKIHICLPFTDEVINIVIKHEVYILLNGFLDTIIFP
jgi:hypothetical protein